MRVLCKFVNLDNFKAIKASLLTPCKNVWRQKNTVSQIYLPTFTYVLRSIH